MASSSFRPTSSVSAFLAVRSCWCSSNRLRWQGIALSSSSGVQEGGARNYGGLMDRPCGGIEQSRRGCGATRRHAGGGRCIGAGIESRALEPSAIVE
jgi:hypothetical protein